MLVLALLLNAKFPNLSHAKSSAPNPSVSAAERAHVVSTFRFEMAGPTERVAPLFAPEAERRWAGDHWKPAFLYPEPGRDVPGTVWTIQFGHFYSAWVNTLDLTSGRIQYEAMAPDRLVTVVPDRLVTVVPDRLVTVVDVRVTALAPAHTDVDVTYTRTALHPAPTEDVRSLGQSDREIGPDGKRCQVSSWATRT